MAQIVFNPNTTPQNVDLDANFTELYNKTAYATTGIGYATGAGGTVTQATSKSTAVTLNKTCGQITLNAAALGAGVTVGFQLNNSLLSSTDILLVQTSSGMADSSKYTVNVGNVIGGAASLYLTNRSGGSLSEAVVLSFAVIKVVTS